MTRENSFSDEGRSITPELDNNSVHENAGPGQSQGNTNASPPANSMQETHPHHPTPHRTASDRFRASVRKVIQLNRASTYISSSRGGIGAEPGIDPRRASAQLHYGHIHQNCEIEIIDYSSVRHSYGRMTNAQLVALLSDPLASRRDSWAKVRWINVGGISWDIVKAIAIRYDLHPLALEDMLRNHAVSLSKADYYPQHLFIRAVCHTLAKDDDSDISGKMADEVAIPQYTEIPRAESPTNMESEELDAFEKVDGIASMVDTSRRKQSLMLQRGRNMRKTDLESSFLRNPGRGFTRLGGLKLAARRERDRAALSVDQLKKGDRVNVRLSPMSIFLMRDGTVITFHTSRNVELTAPIVHRLSQPDTVLRTSADASLLVQAILDLIVDKALLIVDEYYSRILKLEQETLLKPKVRTNRQLHILSGDLILHKRTLEPLRTIIYGLRRYDRDRAAALGEEYSGESQFKIDGFISQRANIYLADVMDHMEYVLSCLDMFTAMCENLINYTFNISSYEMNQVMRRLTLVTIICLPLGLLTGYFGMNFVDFPAVNNHSDLYFWEIAIPVMVVFIPIFTYRDIINSWHYVQQKLLIHNTTKVYDKRHR